MDRDDKRLCGLLLCWFAYFIAAVVLWRLEEPVAYGVSYGAILAGAWLLLTVASLFLINAFLDRRKRLKSIFVTLLPILVPAAVLSAIWTWQDFSDIAHFRAERWKYDAQVEVLPHKGSRFAEFNWGGMLFASRGITYDETDQLVLPSSRQSPAFRARIKETDLYCGRNEPVGEVRSLGDHYYLTTFGC